VSARIRYLAAVPALTVVILGDVLLEGVSIRPGPPRLRALRGHHAEAASQVLIEVQRQQIEQLASLGGDTR
jgi:hypothetical protein